MVARELDHPRAPSFMGDLLPNDPLFRSLLLCAERFPGIAVHDPPNGVSATYNQLVRDIITTRKAIYDAAPLSLLDDRGTVLMNSIWIGLLAPSSYDFVVGCPAILSIGGAVLTMPTTLLPEEADHFLEVSRCRLVVLGQGQDEMAAKIQAYRQTAFRRPVRIARVRRGGESSHCADAVAHLDDTLRYPENRPGLVVWTSGTTGPPKGAMLPRRCLYPVKICSPDERRANLCDRPAHWIGAVTKMIIPLLSGHSIEFKQPGAPASEYWELLRQQRITQVVWGPMVLSRLMQYYEDHLRPLPPAELDPYLDGVRAIRMFGVSSAMPSVALMDAWKKLLDVPVEIGYAATETGGMISRMAGDSHIKSSIGRPVADVEIKLSRGTEGEVLVRGPRVMLGYLNNEEATQAAFDEDGFYRTGDLAHIEGDEYVFDGRASSDFIQVYSFRVPRLEVEEALTSLPYVAEAAVLAVPDEACANQVGALIRPRRTSTPVSLHQVRSDLSKTLPTYTLPTKLRVLSESEALPRTTTDKFKNEGAVARYFQGAAEVEVETCGVPRVRKEAHKAWDWAGM